MNIAEVKELITLVNDSELSLFEFKTEEYYLKMDKSSTRATDTAVAPAVQIQAPQAVQPVSTAVPEVNVSAAKEEAPAKSSAEEGYVVKSPIVGTFYIFPSPEKPAYTEVGKKVKKGDTLCIIEAMKLMNEIESEVNGEVIEILAENESMVEFGQPLFRIRRD